MSITDILSVLGLSLDLIGVVILFFFGIPPGLHVSGQSVMVKDQADHDMKTKLGQRYQKMQKLALAILIVGFALQIVAYFIK